MRVWGFFRNRYSGPMKGAVIWGTALLLLSRLPEAVAIVYPSNHELFKFDYLSPSPEMNGIKRPLTKRDKPIPLIVTNNCPDVLWPGIATQAGEAPDLHGFELGPGQTISLTVGPTWAGRVWGRTNCTVGGETATCQTGDCLGKLNCMYSGAAPATLAEFNLAGGVAGDQTFYDISLVDGYNLPLGVVYHPAENTTYIPPNLVNPTCIGTSGFLSAPSQTGFTYTNTTYPMPYQPTLTNHDISNWCPWDLQAFPPYKPGDGVYPYPDDDIRRPTFDPCLSACTSSHQPQDCCTGEYDDPNVCKPSLYSQYAKVVCPDAYSYAFDDKTSTFIIPMGGGWEVIFCPNGRSTNIQATFPDALHNIAKGVDITPQDLLNAMNLSYIEEKNSAAPAMLMRRPQSLSLWRLGGSCLVVAAYILLG